MCHSLLGVKSKSSLTIPWQHPRAKFEKGHHRLHTLPHPEPKNYNILLAKLYLQRQFELGRIHSLNSFDLILI